MRAAAIFLPLVFAGTLLAAKSQPMEKTHQCLHSAPIGCNESVAGDITTNDCRLQDETYLDEYTFQGATGQQLTIDATSAEMDMYLFLIDPNGAVVAQDDDGGGGLNSRIIFTLNATGEWTIGVNTFGVETGPYNVSVSCTGGPPPPPPPPPPPCTSTTAAIGCGQTANDSLETTDCALADGSRFDEFTFPATRGQEVRIDMSSAAFDTYLILLDPNGQPVAEDDDSGGGFNSRIDYTIPANGGWTIVANSFHANETGPYSVSLACSAPPDDSTCPLNGAPIACNEPVNATLATTDCRNSGGSYDDEYFFVARGGEPVVITHQAAGFGGFVSLVNPSGAVVATSDGNGGSAIPQINATLSQPGTWRILASSVLPNVTGPYTLTLSCDDAPDCATSGPTLCLSERFRVNVTWRDFNGNGGNATASALTRDTGTFWFFHPSNVELTVKIVDGRPLNNRFWVFYGALTNLEYTITVTDTQTGAVRTYHNPIGQFGSAGDVNAFGP